MKIRRHEAEVLRNKPNTEATEAQRAQRVRRNGHGGTESEAQRGRGTKGSSIERAENTRGEERRCQRVARRRDALGGHDSN
jgi:hypothetical protein